MRTDLLWLLRLGYVAVAFMAGILLFFVPHFLEIKSQIAVNTRQIEILKECDNRSELDRKDIHLQLEQMRKRN